MGLLTLEDFKDDLNFALGDKKQPGDRRLGRWINKGYFEVAMYSEYAGLKEAATAVTVVGQSEYVLPEDFLAPLSLTMPDDKKRLIHTSVGALRHRDPDITGTPEYFTVRQESLLLWPTPDTAGSTLLFDYVGEPPPLLNDADLTVLPQYYDQAVHWLALRNAWLDMGQSQRATFFFTTATRYIAFGRDQVQAGYGSEKEGVTVARSKADLTDMKS